MLLSRCRHKCSFFGRLNQLQIPSKTTRFAREVQSHTFPARCGATTGCSLDCRGKAVRPAQIKQLTSASTSSQYVTNTTRLIANERALTAMATRRHRTSVSIQTNMLLQRKHLIKAVSICKPTTAIFPPKLPRRNGTVSRESLHKLLAPILLFRPRRPTLRSPPNASLLVIAC